MYKYYTNTTHHVNNNAVKRDTRDFVRASQAIGHGIIDTVLVVVFYRLYMLAIPKYACKHVWILVRQYVRASDPSITTLDRCLL